MTFDNDTRHIVYGMRSGTVNYNFCIEGNLLPKGKCFVSDAEVQQSAVCSRFV